MITDTLLARLDFLREAERLKNVLRSGHTSTGRPESTAEHSWRLSLMAIVFA
ncbi:HD domain-containing protein, partial [Vibrio astriarenae]